MSATPAATLGAMLGAALAAWLAGPLDAELPRRGYAHLALAAASPGCCRPDRKKDR
jgi:hypothetical protein